jgi:hypothetical protein
MDSDAPANAPRLSTIVQVFDSADALEIMFEAVSKDPTGSFEPFERVVDIFGAAVNAGMFPAQRATPESTAFELLADLSDARALRQRWRVQGVAPGAYKILLSMLGVTHQNQSALASLRLHATGGHGTPLTLSDIAAFPYPKRTEPVGFRLRLPQIRDELGNPNIRIEFAHDLQDDGLELFETWFTAWDHLITHGGYFHVADELELDDDIVLGETYMLSPNTVEHTLERVVGSVEAFDAFINMAVRIHRTIHSVTAFELE